MSKIHRLEVPGNAPATSKARVSAAQSTRAPSAAAIVRLLRSTDQAGLTVYGIEVEGGRILVQTQPTAAHAKPQSEVDARIAAWDKKRGEARK